jgi:hypothetical protein
MVSPPVTSEAGAHASGDTKSEHFEPARVRNFNEKHFRYCFKIIVLILKSSKRNHWQRAGLMIERTSGILALLMKHAYLFQIFTLAGAQTGTTVTSATGGAVDDSKDTVF